MGVSMAGGMKAPHPKKGQSAMDCKMMAEAGGGGYSYDEFGQACWKIYGKAVQFKTHKDTILSGFQVVNRNFNASTAAAPVPTGSSLVGPKNSNLPSDYASGIYNPGA